MKNRIPLLAMGAMVLLLLAGCGINRNAANDCCPKGAPVGGGYKDGAYTGKSSPDDRGAVGELTLTIANEKIVKTDYKTFQKDGKIKDAEYGKTNGKIENEEYYNKAQHAVKAMATYADQLVKVQDVDKIDAISGATVSYRQFVEAAKQAMDQARTK